MSLTYVYFMSAERWTLKIQKRRPRKHPIFYFFWGGDTQGFDFASFSGHLPRFDPSSPRKIEKCPVAPFLPRIEKCLLHLLQFNLFIFLNLAFYYINPIILFNFQ